MNFCKKYTGSNNQYDKQCYFSERCSYKSLLSEKKEQYSAKMVSELEINMCNAKLFWQNIKKLGSEAGLTSNISEEVWHDHFYNVFNTHFNVLTEIDGLYIIFQQYPLIHDDINMLNGVFTEETGCRNVSFVIAYRCSILTKTV